MREKRKSASYTLVVPTWSSPGEPLLQQKELAPLVTCLKGRGFYFEVETNGTIMPHPN